MVEYANWRQYQEQTAAAFRRLGFTAEVDYTAAGVRARHDIDVYVTFTQQSIPCTWVVECKLWATRVPKEKILALKSIVDDLGADRGIIVSEAGFQPGAQDAARGTNITLVTSLEEFERTARASASAPLTYLEVEGEAPIYQFPAVSEPQQLLVYRDQLITANWRSGTITFIDPRTKAIVETIELDRYEVRSDETSRIILNYPPGSMAIADGRLFVGQVFSEFVLVIDIATQAIVKRLVLPGGGEGELAASHDERTVYFASNRVPNFYVIDSATYSLDEVPYPGSGRGCMALAKHPASDILYLGLQRGGALDGQQYPGGNCFLAAYDFTSRSYVAQVYLADVVDGRSDDATPACISFDERSNHLYVGMFQSMLGIRVIDAATYCLVRNISVPRNGHNEKLPWADPMSQAFSEDLVLSVNRNNCELAILDRVDDRALDKIFLGVAPNGPRAVVLWNEHAIVSYPGRNGLIFLDLSEVRRSVEVSAMSED
ncbi:restriction endonuclease [Paraburkholderia phytofirmans]|uniref:restriction endonuclease n=1 Tax=Paraburkholderia phytofirmans TaxID=261302 RepID=UPI000B0865B1|nr:restriction endonuclease [Paraburkholderia phytofirmans]